MPGDTSPGTGGAGPSSQFFRTLKLQGLRIEDSPTGYRRDASAKLVAIAASAGRHRSSSRPGPATAAIANRQSLAFDQHEIKLIAILNQQMQGNTARQKNPSPQTPRLDGMGHRQTRRMA